MSHCLKQSEWLFELVAQDIFFDLLEPTKSLACKHLTMEVTDGVDLLPKVANSISPVNHSEDPLFEQVYLFLFLLSCGGGAGKVEILLEEHP